MDATLGNVLGIALVVLVALGIGMLMPVLAQAKRTLSVAERRFDRIGAQVEEVLDDTRRVVRRVDRMTEDLEESGVPAARLVESMAGLATTLESVRDRVGTVAAIASTVGPAVVSAYRAWRGDGHDEFEGVPSDGDGMPHN
jgi:uncharacterized protein YoxC